jgi:hypothetical protein
MGRCVAWGPIVLRGRQLGATLLVGLPCWPGCPATQPRFHVKHCIDVGTGVARGGGQYPACRWGRSFCGTKPPIVVTVECVGGAIILLGWRAWAAFSIRWRSFTSARSRFYVERGTSRPRGVRATSASGSRVLAARGRRAFHVKRRGPHSPASELISALREFSLIKAPARPRTIPALTTSRFAMQVPQRSLFYRLPRSMTGCIAAALITSP